MKLIGSITEEKIREELTIARRNLFRRGKRSPEFLSVLRSHFPNLLSVFILNWTPEQREDIYVAMIDNQFIATIEMTRDGREVAFETESVDTYRKGLRDRKKHIRLAVALDIFAGSPIPS